MSGVKKQGVRKQRFIALFGAAALLHPKNPTVLFLKEMLNHRGLEKTVKYYYDMLAWLPK